MIQFLRNLKNIRKVYLDYETALKASSPKAYQADELIDVVFQKTMKFKQSLNKYPIYISPSIANSICSLVPIITEKENKQIHIIDFGGACGALYFQIRHFIPQNLKIQWAVVETPAMVLKAKSLENEELTFHDSLDSALNILPNLDIFHTSGTIQALSKPREYLQKIVNLRARYIFFNRVGVNQGNKDIYTVHRSKLSWNGPGVLPEGFQDKWVKYPFSFLSEDFFLNTIQKLYNIITKFEDNSGFYPVWGYKVKGYAILGKIKE